MNTNIPQADNPVPPGKSPVYRQTSKSDRLGYTPRVKPYRSLDEEITKAGGTRREMDKLLAYTTESDEFLAGLIGERLVHFTKDSDNNERLEISPDLSLEELKALKESLEDAKLPPVRKVNGKEIHEMRVKRDNAQRIMTALIDLVTKEIESKKKEA